MPVAGEIKYDYEIGRPYHGDKYIWVVCHDCHKERWAKLADTRKEHWTGLCKRCCLRRRNGKLERSPNWKGGIKEVAGYVYIRLREGHPYWEMAKEQGYVKRSRLIMAEFLGRILESCEEVHHKDGNSLNDALDNLRLFSNRAAHVAHHRKQELATFGKRPVDEKGQYVKGGYHAH